DNTAISCPEVAASELVFNHEARMWCMVARNLSILLCALGAGLAPYAAAQQTGVDLAKARNCLSCHQVDRKVVGPAFTVIAERFAGSDGASEYLAQAIREGGRGRW